MMFARATVLCLLLSAALGAQTFCTQGTILKHDTLPANPSGAQNVSIIQGLCEGEAAASVFDVSSLGPTVTVNECGILFAASGGATAASGRLQIYDGVTIAPNGAATLGPKVYETTGALQYSPNAFNTADISASNVVITSGKLVVAFTMDINLNYNIPFLGCAGGYYADFATDNTAGPGSPCTTQPGTNLLLAQGAGWWDVTQFSVGGTPICGIAYNGNWVIRACVTNSLPPATYPGTAADLVLASSVGLTTPDLTDVKSTTAGDYMNFGITSPGGGLVGLELLFVVELFPTGAPPASPFPGIAVTGNPASTFLLVGDGAGPFGPALIPPQGFNAAYFVPAGLAGTSGLFQAIVPWVGAQNGIFESTDGHEFQVM
ncbi:MAG: hypothetical protein R3F20_02930 [Planctomycetota bacterium]